MEKALLCTNLGDLVLVKAQLLQSPVLCQSLCQGLTGNTKSAHMFSQMPLILPHHVLRKEWHHVSLGLAGLIYRVFRVYLIGNEAPDVSVSRKQ